MPNEALIKFAEELKEARESKKITLNQIANKTKIDIKFLQAIEEAKFDVLPELYIRAFIKEYAHFVGLNLDEIIKRFDSASHGKTEEKAPHEDKKEIQEKQTINELNNSDQKSTGDLIKPLLKKLKFNYNYGIVAVFILLVLTYFLFIKESTQENIADESLSSTVEEVQPAFEIDSSKTVTNYKPLNDSLQLSVNTLNRVWVKVLSDKNLRYEGMVNANENLRYNASKEFRVVVGNAGNVKLAFNNKPINEETVGQKGEIRNLIINADTIKAYTIIIPAKNENESSESN